MPDLPTPKDAAEAALFSECWDAVLSYADLCTSGSTAANQPAREAFALGIREARAAEDGTARGAGRRSSRLPRIPLLLTAVRTTAAAWEARGQGHKLDPDLRLWLNSDKAARYVGPPLSRPIALRGLRDMQEPDAALLWLAEVEALPLQAVVRRQGLDPTAAVEELNQVRGLFRDRCHRNHLDTPMDAECRSYVRLLDAVTRSPAADTPPISPATSPPAWSARRPPPVCGCTGAVCPPPSPKASSAGAASPIWSAAAGPPRCASAPDARTRRTPRARRNRPPRAGRACCGAACSPPPPWCPWWHSPCR